MFVNEGLNKVVFVGCRKIICKITLRQTQHIEVRVISIIHQNLYKHLILNKNLYKLLAKFERSKLKFL